MEEYIFTFETPAQEERFLRLAQEAGVSTMWIAVNSTPEYGHEQQFTNEEVWPDLSEAVAGTVGAEAEGWPETPLDQWPQRERRDLIRTAVTQWDYLGPDLMDQSVLLGAFRRGEVPNPGASASGGPERPDDCARIRPVRNHPADRMT